MELTAEWPRPFTASHVKRSINTVVELIVAGEVQYRESILGRQQWLIECKFGIEEEARRRKEEEECRPQQREIAQKEGWPRQIEWTPFSRGVFLMR